MGLKIWCENENRTHDFRGYPLYLSSCIFILGLGDYRFDILSTFVFDFNFRLPIKISLMSSQIVNYLQGLASNDIQLSCYNLTIRNGISRNLYYEHSLGFWKLLSPTKYCTQRYISRWLLVLSWCNVLINDL